MSFGIIIIWFFVFWGLIALNVVVSVFYLYQKNKLEWEIGKRIKKFFKRNNRKDTDEEPERSEDFNKIKVKIDRVKVIKSMDGLELTPKEEEDKSWVKFLPKSFEKLPEEAQIIRKSEPRNEDKEINKMYKEIKEMYSKTKKMYEEVMALVEIKKENYPKAQKNAELPSTLQKFQSECQEIKDDKREEFSPKLIGSLKGIVKRIKSEDAIIKYRKGIVEQLEKFGMIGEFNKKYPAIIEKLKKEQTQNIKNN